MARRRARRNPLGSNVLTAVAVVGGIAAIGAAIYFYKQKRDAEVKAAVGPSMLPPPGNQASPTPNPNVGGGLLTAIPHPSLEAATTMSAPIAGPTPQRAARGITSADLLAAEGMSIAQRM